MTETEENQIAVDAEMRRRQKAERTARATAAILSAPISDTLEQSLSRLQALGAMPINKPPEDNSDKVAELRKEAGIPKRHNQEIPHAQTQWQTRREELAARFGSGFLIAIVGVQGTGKTQLGASLIHDATDRLKPCKFASAMGFFIDLKSSFSDDAESKESAILARYTKPKFLVLDEMDERSESAWENRLLFHMLNQRYNSMLDTLLISRRTKSEFLASVGASIQSRLQETGGIIECNWPSFRARRAS